MCYCKTCSNLTTTEVAVIELKGGRTLRFYCKNCLSGESNMLFNKIIDGKDKLIESKEKMIELLEDQLMKMKSEIEGAKNTQRSYAEVLSSKEIEYSVEKKKPNVPYLICKPKKPQDCSKTRKDIQTKIKVSKLTIGINSTKEKKNGCLLIRCDSKKSCDEMREQLQTHLVDGYDITESKLRSPSLFIGNIDLEFTEQDIVDGIGNQNYMIDEDDQFKVSMLRKAKNGRSQFAIIECNGSCFAKLMASGSVFLGMRRCIVRENLRVIRCFRCFGFNHKSGDCRYDGPEKCSRCTLEHNYRDCRSAERVCVNCSESNRSFRTRYDTHHETMDDECPLYRLQVDKMKDRTDYSITKLN